MTDPARPPAPFALVLGPGGERESPAFDGESAPARELLRLLRAAEAEASGPRTA
ncbi:hypothetical protein IQ279_01040 [Streptomyces verrucosisporus]|uniref:hypothetical protein n=1 Tax=Streptomyces verrucosisporus TaxID=1695161 RepID=UPI0019CFF01B|nr:hypothetical protein [Streptomyces verrucosisporus]MBN3928241.1 hypothetical protein [Streptomyces verrucosisporus]